MPVKNCLHKVTPAVHSVILISLTPWVTMPLQYTCKSGGNLIVRHNCLRGTFCESCKLACITGQIEGGCGLDVEGSCALPALFLVHTWEFGKPAALDFTITSPL